jgi:hypothetical protein
MPFDVMKAKGWWAGDSLSAVFAEACHHHHPIDPSQAGHARGVHLPHNAPSVLGPLSTVPPILPLLNIHCWVSHCCVITPKQGYQVSLAMSYRLGVAILPRVQIPPFSIKKHYVFPPTI